MPHNYDFAGWATRNDVLCSDGRIIRQNAFQHNDGQTVPLVWNHQHNNPSNVLGSALLENRPRGVYAYCSFNNTENGQNAKEFVQHGDVCSLSIYADKLKQKGHDVIHGAIREVSLVLAGANEGAKIETIIQHSDSTDEEAVIFSGEFLSLFHAEETDEQETEEPDKEENMAEEKLVHADEQAKEPEKKEKTVKDVIDSMTEEQKTVMYALVGQALEEAGASDNSDDEEENSEMKHNIFDTDTQQEENTLMHSAMEAILADGKRCGTLKESFLQHAEEYGITNIDYLFPETRTLNAPPEFIKRDMDWVSKVMNGVHKSPFSRIKSVFANITEDEARAKGYIKGKLKKEEVFSLLKRSTTPTTIYKKQKMDRDDVVDITDFDVVAWLKSEMRMMLDEEIARAILIGDGRLNSDDDKIKEDNIRPIVKDADLFTIKAEVSVAANATEDDIAKAFIRKAIKQRKDYKGSGQPKLFTTEDMLTDMLLLTDEMGRDLYPDEAALAKKLRVSEIITTPVMENQKGANGGDLLGVIVNLKDYNVGADKGGSVNMFEDFDIDYNQQKYLIETRCSGALTVPYSAIALELAVGQ